MDRIEVITRVERRRKWTDAEKAAVLAETDTPGTNIAAVARKHGIARSVVYNWRSARRAHAIAAIPSAEPVEFIPIGVVDGAQAVASSEPLSVATSAADNRPTPSADHGGMIEVEFADGPRLRVDGLVNERAPCRVLWALKSLGWSAWRLAHRSIWSAVPSISGTASTARRPRRNRSWGPVHSLATYFSSVVSARTIGLSEGALLGCVRPIPVRQAAGEGPVRLAADRRWRLDPDARTARAADRGYGLETDCSTAADTAPWIETPLCRRRL